MSFQTKKNKGKMKEVKQDVESIVKKLKDIRGWLHPNAI